MNFHRKKMFAISRQIFRYVSWFYRLTSFAYFDSNWNKNILSNVFWPKKRALKPDVLVLKYFIEKFLTLFFFVVETDCFQLIGSSLGYWTHGVYIDWVIAITIECYFDLCLSQTKECSKMCDNDWKMWITNEMSFQTIRIFYVKNEITNSYNIFEPNFNNYFNKRVCMKTCALWHRKTFVDFFFTQTKYIFCHKFFIVFILEKSVLQVSYTVYCHLFNV